MRLFFTALALSATLTACMPKSDDVRASLQKPMSTGLIESPTWSSKTVNYRCKPDTELQVAYLNMKSGEAFAALYYQGRLSLLQIRASASGARYIALDEQNSLRWRTKGDHGFLTFLAADHTAVEQTLLSDCQADKAQ
ncbi:MAG: MliC family protein [Methylococcaceae bacterium]